MKRYTCDVAVIGGGPAGLAAAVAAKDQGAGCVLVIERNSSLGGILPQCIHNGFGVSIFGSDLTGPEYAQRWVDRAKAAGVDVLLDTMVLEVDGSRRVVASNASDGLLSVEPKALVLAMGCRERPRGALAIPGTRPAGVLTAGTAQRLVNIEGYMPGERVVILGSGDIGMIMARRMTLEGARVEVMAEVLPYISGLRRNLVQCVRDFDIPLELCTTVVDIAGDQRVESVTLAQVDTNWRPVPGTEHVVPCDTLLLSVGLQPENELSRMAGVALDPITGGPYVDQHLATSVPGIYAAGNVVHVYDLVDEVTESALVAGASAGRYALGLGPDLKRTAKIIGGDLIHHVVPQTVALDGGEARIEFRARRPIEHALRARIRQGDTIVASKRLRYARPSEMITIELDKATLAKVEGDLVVELVGLKGEAIDD